MDLWSHGIQGTWNSVSFHIPLHDRLYIYLISYFEGKNGTVSIGIAPYCTWHDMKKKWDKARRLRKIAFYISLNKSIVSFLPGADLLKIRDYIKYRGNFRLQKKVGCYKNKKRRKKGGRSKANKSLQLETQNWKIQEFPSKCQFPLTGLANLYVQDRWRNT